LSHEPQTEATASSDAVSPYLSVVVPAFNEEKRLGPSLKRMLAYFDSQPYSYEILVVSDGSTDGTEELVRRMSACRPQVQLLAYTPNRGKGHAVRYGMLGAKGERLLFTDADLATPIEEVEKLHSKLDAGYDIAIGSRDVLGSELVKRQSWLRETAGKTFNRLVRLLTVPGIHDTQCGFKLFSRSAAHTIFSRCRIDHFAFDVEVLYLAIRVFEFQVAEVPVRWAHQEGSKVHLLRDGLRMVRAVWRIRTTRYRGITAPSLELPLR